MTTIRPAHRTALLLAGSFVLLSFGLMWGLPHIFDFAQDSVVPMGELARQGFDFGKVTAFRYPPFHFWVLKVCFLPGRVLAGLPSFAENEKLRSTVFILTARLVSVAMALGTLVALARVGRRLWDEGTGYAAAAFFILSPLTLYYGKNANLDIPYIFWLAWATFFYVRVLQENRERDYLWLGVFAALAVCTKDQAYGYVLLMPAPIIWKLWRERMGHKNPEQRTTEHPTPNTQHQSNISDIFRRLGMAALGVLVPFVIIHNLLLDWPAFQRHVATIIGPASEGWRMFTAGPVGQARLLVETLLRLADAWTLAGLALVGTGLAVGLGKDDRRGLRAALLLPAISYYASFIAVVGYVPTRFVLPLMLALAPFAGRGVMWLGKPGKRALLGRVAAALLLVWVGLAGLSVDFVMARFPRYEAQMWLEREVSPEWTMCWIGSERDMPRFNKPLDPTPCEPNEAAVREADPHVIVLSLDQGHPAARSPCRRLSSVARRGLGDWGKTPSARGRGKERGFYQRLAEGDLGYREVVRFQSPIARLVPEVCESLNRTILVLVKEPAR